MKGEHGMTQVDSTATGRGAQDQRIAEEQEASQREDRLPFAGRAGRLLAFAAGAFAVAFYLRLRYPGVPDPDSFYHLGHAMLYAERGPGTKAFPWIFYSAINQFSGDVGYGFHFLLIPFTLARDPILGIKLAAVFETAAVLITVGLVMRRHRVAYSFAWPFLLIFAAPPLVYTFLMTRPQTLTMGLLAVLISFLVVGSAWGVFLASLAIGFVHLNVFPIVFLVVVVVGLTKLVVARRWEWPKWVAASAGVAAGWLLRPNPLGVLKIERLQIVVHEAARRAHLPLSFGREWEPVTAAALAAFAYFLVLWGIVSVAFLVAAVRRRSAATPEDRTLLWSTLFLSIIFFGVTMLATKRATPLWVSCVVLFAAKAFTSLLHPAQKGKAAFSEEVRIVAAFATAGLAALMVWDGLSSPLTQRAAESPYRMKATAEWLGQHGRAGEIVYNVHWDTFPELFLWNRHSYYVSGLDPIFLYAYDEKMCWKAHHIATNDTGGHTWGTMKMGVGQPEDTYTFVSRDLHASHIVIDSRRTPALQAYLQRDPRFELAFRDGPFAIYSVR